MGPCAIFPAITSSLRMEVVIMNVSHVTCKQGHDLNFKSMTSISLLTRQTCSGVKKVGWETVV